MGNLGKERKNFLKGKNKIDRGGLKRHLAWRKMGSRRSK